MNSKIHILLLITAAFSISTACSAQSGMLAAHSISEDEYMDLSLEELMQVKIITATRIQQPITKAPATVLVVTAEQIEARNYRSLLDVIQDLPGFVINDFVHTYPLRIGLQFSDMEI